MNRAVIFDLDGTLWDVFDSTFDSANIVAEKYGLKRISKDTICKGFGCNKEESAKLYFPYLEYEKSKDIMDEISKVNIENLRKNGGGLYPHLEETLKILKENYDLYIVSNTGKEEYIEAFLISSKLEEYFKDYAAASFLGISKANAINKVIADNAIEQAVYVGDTIKDLEAAKGANVPFVYAKYGFGKVHGTEFFIEKIEELPNALRKI